MFHSFQDKLELPNGVQMPCMSFGTWQVPNDTPLLSAVSSAIQFGYRSFDTAQIYSNAATLGRAIRDSMIPREEFFSYKQNLGDTPSSRRREKSTR